MMGNLMEKHGEASVSLLFSHSARFAAVRRGIHAGSKWEWGMHRSSRPVEAIQLEVADTVRCRGSCRYARAARPALAHSPQRGFTLVELIMTLVIVGIIAVVVAPRFFDSNVFRSRGFADQVQASLRYAQKVAIAQRRNVCVAFDSVAVPNTITLTIDSDTPPDGTCNPAPAGNLQSPTGEPGYVVNAPAGVGFGTAPAPADFSFNALGTPSAAQTINITGATNGITIEAETGYAHSP